MDERGIPAAWFSERFPGSFEEFCEKQRASVLQCRPEWAGTDYDHLGGFSWKRFDKFAKSFEQGDELWFFVTPGGWEGYAIVREGEVVDSIITLYTS